MTMTRMFLPAVILVLWASPGFAQKTYSDPVSYCKAVGTIDKPDARYTGPKLPAWMAKQLNMQPDQGKLMEWRCAGGAVLACQYGANIPCDSKAVTSQKPTQPIVDRRCVRQDPLESVRRHAKARRHSDAFDSRKLPQARPLAANDRDLRLVNLLEVQHVASHPLTSLGVDPVNSARVLRFQRPAGDYAARIKAS